jgi:threonine dehydrogenase-like Zn-dependent dehydrogenase
VSYDEAGLIDTEKIISHRFGLPAIHEAINVMETTEHNKVIINP